LDDPEGTGALAQAIRKNGHVVLGADFIYSDHLGKAGIERPVLPAPMLLAATPHYGFASFRDDDIILRQHFHGSTDAPSLSWEVARILGAEVTEDPKGQQGERWINYYGPRGTLPSMPFQVVLGKDTPPRVLTQSLTNHVVFIGSATQAGYTGTRQDQFRTPF